MHQPPSRTIRRVNLKDIALQAGVSIGSVSSVLNNRQLERRIPPETAAKIREVASRLGYLPNISARRLRSGEGVKNTLILALVTSFEAPIPLVNHFVSALHKEAAKISRTGLSFSFMIEMFSAGRLKDLPGLLTGDHFNAAVILNTVAADDQFLLHSHLPYPAVLINRSIADFPCVIEDPASGARVAEILVKKNRSTLTVLHGSPMTQATQNRVDSFFRRVLELTGRPAGEIVADKLSEEGGYRAMKDALKKEKRCDGLYAVSDALALGAYRALKEYSLKIPKDIAVVGVGDYEIAPFFDPPLSCVGVSHRELAAEASRLLFQQIFGEPVSPRISLPILEILRESSGH